MRKNESDQGAKVVQYVSAILIGTVLALLICLLLLLLWSVLISLGLLNDRNMQQYTIVSSVLGGFFGGLFAVSRCRSRTLLVGAGVGCAMFLLVLTVSVIFFCDVSVEKRGIGLFGACLIGGVLSGLLGAKTKKKRRK